MTSRDLAARTSQKYSLQIGYSESNERRIPSVLIDAESWDAWRHLRMYSHLDPILSEDQEANWLTVGDNGADAHYIRLRSRGEVTASSISRGPLDAAATAGFLENVEIRELNAEAIDLPNGSFDYLYCKETYHHLARPPVGLYEFMRIARRAVILCEPSETYPPKALDKLRVLVKFLVRGERRDQVEFEQAGNFIFRVSISEVKKMAIALGCNRIYWRYFNDFFVRGLVHYHHSATFAGLALRAGIAFQSALCRLRLMNWGKCTVVIWMCDPPQRIDRRLRDAGFSRFDVPTNPYVGPASSN